ncbi:hypothetical protein H8356DRAFT_1077115 [Neocallimastix lanati (nom. inval.)]|nr:hypothetical protein H8356DRAFT_1077115 [Neocallimastix sp. JGI-2020a]
MNYIGPMFNKRLRIFRKRIKNWQISLEMENFYKRNTPLQYSSFRFIIDFIMKPHIRDPFFNSDIEQPKNFQLMNFQPLKLVIGEENDERRNSKKIEVPLTFSLGIPDEANIYLIKIKYIITQHDFNDGDILSKLENKEGISGKINLN